MKRSIVMVFLVGVIILLAAGLIGTLLYIRNQPAPQRGFQPIVEITPLEPDSSQWGINYPNEYSTFLITADNITRTRYGGSEKISQLQADPRLVILFAGYSFSRDYNEERGHMNSLIDVRATLRLDEKTPGTCYSCKSSDNPALWAEMGMAGYDHTPFRELGLRIDQPIGCANCHEAGTMRLVVTNPALEEALLAQGKDWQTFTRQEMRTVVCANCHVEYYFAGEGKYLTFPWENGTRIDQILAYYDALNFKDWEYPQAGTFMLKAQHPEFEFYTMDSTHYQAGVACADCHMPYVRDGAAKFSSHDVHSPLLGAELACGQCHNDVTYAISRVQTIQDEIHAVKISTEDAILDAISAIQSASQVADVDSSLLGEARALHRRAQFMWDFVSAENSMGFHNPEYALSILAEAANLARQAQIKAAQAARDLDLIVIGVYYTLPESQPVETPTP